MSGKSDSAVGKAQEQLESVQAEVEELKKKLQPYEEEMNRLKSLMKKAKTKEEKQEIAKQLGATRKQMKPYQSRLKQLTRDESKDQKKVKNLLFGHSTRAKEDRAAEVEVQHYLSVLRDAPDKNRDRTWMALYNSLKQYVTKSFDPASGFSGIRASIRVVRQMVELVIERQLGLVEAGQRHDEQLSAIRRIPGIQEKEVEEIKKILEMVDASAHFSASQVGEKWKWEDLAKALASLEQLELKRERTGAEQLPEQSEKSSSEQREQFRKLFHPNHEFAETIRALVNELYRGDRELAIEHDPLYRALDGLYRYSESYSSRVIIQECRVVLELVIQELLAVSSKTN
jgi:hypothetical protein